MIETTVYFLWFQGIKESPLHPRSIGNGGEAIYFESNLFKNLNSESGKIMAYNKLPVVLKRESNWNYNTKNQILTTKDMPYRFTFVCTSPASGFPNPQYSASKVPTFPSH